jgi:hypothetical protein
MPQNKGKRNQDKHETEREYERFTEEEVAFLQDYDQEFEDASKHHRKALLEGVTDDYFSQFLPE